MAIENYLNQAADRIKLNFSFEKENMTDYLQKYALKGYFENLPEEERKALRGSLEDKVSNSLSKYQGELRGIGRKTLTNSAMGLAVLNDLSAYTSATSPFLNVGFLGYTLFALKTVAEIPAMYRYLKKSHDWYGELKHIALKPIKYLIPVVGPALEAGSFERMVKARAMKEAKDEFIKSHGNYVPFEERLEKKLATPLREAIQIAA